MAGTGDLEQHFRTNDGPLISKWLHYFDVYERHLAGFRGRPITMVEIGVFQGGSMAMWSQYFGPEARIIGVDVDDRARAFETDQVRIFIGDQEDPAFLTSLAEEVGPIDVLLDDGGHTVGQQMTTFATLWPHVVDGGVVLVEDLHTNYWPEYGGGLGKPDTFIEFAKGLIDSQHAWHAREAGPAIDDYTRSVTGLHSYDSIVVVEKGVVEAPQNALAGRLAFEPGSGEVLHPVRHRSTGSDDPSVLNLELWRRVDAAAARNEELQRECDDLAARNEELTRLVAELDTRTRELAEREQQAQQALANLQQRLPDRVLRKLRKARGK